MRKATPVDTTSGGNKRFWYVPDLIVTALLFAFITYVHSSFLVWYIGGLHNRAPFMFDPYFMHMIWLLPAAGICLLVLLARLALSWPVHIHDTGRLRTLRLSVILGVVAYASLHFVPIPGEYGEPFLLGYRKYARTHVDVPAIRAWLDTEDPNIYEGGRIHLTVLTDKQRADLPQAITSLKPCWIELFLDARNQRAIRLDWGHVNDDWGVEIGRPDMEMTSVQSTDVAERLHASPFHRLPLAPGVYVWNCPH